MVGTLHVCSPLAAYVRQPFHLRRKVVPFFGPSWYPADGTEELNKIPANTGFRKQRSSDFNDSDDVTGAADLSNIKESHFCLNSQN